MYDFLLGTYIQRQEEYNVFSQKECILYSNDARSLLRKVYISEMQKVVMLNHSWASSSNNLAASSLSCYRKFSLLTEGKKDRMELLTR